MGSGNGCWVTSTSFSTVPLVTHQGMIYVLCVRNYISDHDRAEHCICINKTTLQEIIRYRAIEIHYHFPWPISWKLPPSVQHQLSDMETHLCLATQCHRSVPSSRT